MPAYKGQKFKSYSIELKQEAIRLYTEEGWTYQQITEHFQIQDRQRVKKWVRKYRELNQLSFLDRRGRKNRYVDQARHIDMLKEENAMLKKCLAIWTKVVRKSGSKRLKLPLKSILFFNCVNFLRLHEVVTMLI